VSQNDVTADLHYKIPSFYRRLVSLIIEDVRSRIFSSSLIHDLTHVDHVDKPPSYISPFNVAIIFTQ